MPYFSGEKMTGGYGGPDIINSCSINVNKGEIVTILGPNGAGKSTAMKAMLGMLNLHQGKVTFNDTEIIISLVSFVCTESSSSLNSISL